MTEDNKEVSTEQQPQNNAETLNEKTAETLNGEKKVDNGGDQLTETNVEPPKEMKCIQISGFGGLKTVKILKKPEPNQPGDGEVVVRVHSAGLSFNDLLCRQGNLLNLPKTPFTLGFEAAGVIESVGENVDLKVGDRVACLTNTNAFSELVLVNSKYVYKLPDNIDFDNAVALTLNFVFAHYLLFEVSNLKAGQTIFIQSCSGGVGQALVQLASSLENITIIGTASKPKHEKIENVNHLFDHSDDYVTEIKKLFPDGINLVLAPEYSDMNKLISLLRPLGHYVLYGSSNNVSNNGGLIGAAKFWWQSDKIKPNKLFEENKTVSGFNLRQYLYSQNGHEHVKEIVEKVYNLFLDGKIKPTIDSRHAFEDVTDAMLRLHDRQNVGKVILDAKLEPKPKPVEEEKPAKKSRFGSKSQKKVKEEKQETNGNKEEANGNKEETNGNKEEENGKVVEEKQEENKKVVDEVVKEENKDSNGLSEVTTNGEVKVEN